MWLPWSMIGRPSPFNRVLRILRLGLVPVAQRLVGLEMRDLAAAPAATAGGSEVVKMKPGA